MVLPLRLRDISPGTSWPSHLVELICGSPPRDSKIRVEEVAACLCHVALVEIGFVPTFIGMDAETVSQIPELERIPIMSKEIPAGQKNSAAGVFTISYRGIQEREVKNPDPLEAENVGKPEFHYNYTKPADVIMVAQNNTLSIYGTVKTEGAVPASLNLQLHLQDFLRVQPSQPSPATNKIFCESRSGQDWLNLIQLKGSTFSDTVKRNFGLQLLTLVDGMSFEAALTHLPPEVLLRIFRRLDIRTILNLSETSWYFFGATESDFFWLSLIDRDFPRQAKDVRTALLANSSNQAAQGQGDRPTPYTEYRRLYISALPPHPRRFSSFHQLAPRRSRAPNFFRSMFMFRQV